MMNDNDELIRQRAYEIWEREGRPECQERRHWEQASREIAEHERQPLNSETADESGTGTIVAPSTAPRGEAGRPSEDAD